MVFFIHNLLLKPVVPGNHHYVYCAAYSVLFDIRYIWVHCFSADIAVDSKYDPFALFATQIRIADEKAAQ